MMKKITILSIFTLFSLGTTVLYGMEGNPDIERTWSTGIKPRVEGEPIFAEGEPETYQEELTNMKRRPTRPRSTVIKPQSPTELAKKGLNRNDWFKEWLKERQTGTEKFVNDQETEEEKAIEEEDGSTFYSNEQPPTSGRRPASTIGYLVEKVVYLKNDTDWILLVGITNQLDNYDPEQIVRLLPGEQKEIPLFFNKNPRASRMITPWRIKAGLESDKKKRSSYNLEETLKESADESLKVTLYNDKGHLAIHQD